MALIPAIIKKLLHAIPRLHCPSSGSVRLVIPACWSAQYPNPGIEVLSLRGQLHYWRQAGWCPFPLGLCHNPVARVWHTLRPLLWAANPTVQKVNVNSFPWQFKADFSVWEECLQTLSHFSLAVYYLLLFTYLFILLIICKRPISRLCWMPFLGFTGHLEGICELKH